MYPVLEAKQLAGINTWHAIQCDGQLPTARLGHSCVSFYQPSDGHAVTKVIILAGATTEKPLDDAFIFDTGTHSLLYNL